MLQMTLGSTLRNNGQENLLSSFVTPTKLAVSWETGTGDFLNLCILKKPNSILGLPLSFYSIELRVYISLLKTTYIYVAMS